MQPLCSLNSRLAPLAETAISPLDRGLLFGDGVYETLRVVAHQALRVPEHLARLRRSLDAISIAEPPGVEAAIHDLLDASDLDTGSLFLQITRGVGPRTHLPSPALTPTLLLLPSEHPHAAPGSRRLRVVTYPDPRWQRCDIKATSLLGAVLGKLHARDHEQDEVVFVGPRGELREGGSTSLFVRRGDHLETHPLDGHVLAGITRARVFAWAAAEGLPIAERAPQLEERGEWLEMFLCGTLTGVQPVSELDGEPVAGGALGEWTSALGRRAAAEEARLAT
jgi:D-alanine transaminase